MCIYITSYLKHDPSKIIACSIPYYYSNYTYSIQLGGFPQQLVVSALELQQQLPLLLGVMRLS